ncbi:O-antigen ligase domain-containing protein [Aquabacterium soli]|uniref:O-antigen ligase domain-containing protein n=1 Tax=Aquabacterium soli TaxID=2493092 RepID=A0A426UZD2_9BURK|nr:O-antigen ligase family protein [Aquabacterium soli]RRR99940.1 O-antigen ligase domain-containing protein [Aquabacterium soli]
MQIVIPLLAAVFALVAAIGLCFGLFWTFNNKASPWVGWSLVTLLCLAALALTLVVPSPFQYYVASRAGVISTLAGMGSKAVVLAFLLVSAVGAVLAVIQRMSHNSGKAVHHFDNWALIFWASLLSIIGASLLSALFGIVKVRPWSGDFRKILYFPAALIMVWHFRDVLTVGLLQRGFLILANFCALVSLALLPVASIAVTVPGTEYLPGFNSRLSGVLGTPTTTGFIAASAVLLYIFSPEIKSRARIFWILLNLATLILAQSKASLAALFALFFVGLLIRPNGTVSQRAVAMCAIGLGLCAMPFFLMDASSRLSNSAAQEVATFSGRMQIWQITLDAWKNNPIFGFGPLLWGPDFRRDYAPPHLFNLVGMAHNQFVHTLGESGVIGLLALLFHISVVGWLSFDVRKQDGGVSMLLWIFIIIRCMTEAPFLNHTISANGVVLLLLYRHLFLKEKKVGLKIVTECRRPEMNAPTKVII